MLHQALAQKEGAFYIGIDYIIEVVLREKFSFIEYVCGCIIHDNIHMPKSLQTILCQILHILGIGQIGWQDTGLSIVFRN